VEGHCPFHDLSVGEAAAPDLSGECGGGKTPLQIRRRKDQAESLGLRTVGPTPRKERQIRPHDNPIAFSVMDNVNNKMLSLLTKL